MDINTKFGLMLIAKSYAEEYREEKKKLEKEKVEPLKKKKFKVKNKDWVWCCGNKIPKDMEAVGCSYCF